MMGRPTWWDRSSCPPRLWWWCAPPRRRRHRPCCSGRGSAGPSGCVGVARAEAVQLRTVLLWPGGRTEHPRPCVLVVVMDALQHPALPLGRGVIGLVRGGGAGDQAVGTLAAVDGVGVRGVRVHEQMLGAALVGVQVLQERPRQRLGGIRGASVLVVAKHQLHRSARGAVAGAPVEADFLAPLAAGGRCVEVGVPVDGREGLFGRVGEERSERERGDQVFAPAASTPPIPYAACLLACLRVNRLAMARPPHMLNARYHKAMGIAGPGRRRLRGSPELTPTTPQPPGCRCTRTRSRRAGHRRGRCRGLPLRAAA